MSAFLTALGTTATGLISNLTTAAGAGLGIFALVVGVRWVLNIFKSASK